MALRGRNLTGFAGTRWKVLYLIAFKQHINVPAVCNIPESIGDLNSIKANNVSNTRWTLFFNVTFRI
jgi:hypothetical protein